MPYVPDPSRKPRPARKKKTPANLPAAKEREKSEILEHQSELVGPLILMGVGVLLLAFAIPFYPLPVPILLKLLILGIFIVGNFVLSLAALFIAASLFDLGFGLFSTALPKLLAIVLVQTGMSLIEDIIVYALPVPFLGFFLWLIELSIIFGMIQWMFEMDFEEARIALVVMFVVRLIGWVMMIVLLASMAGAAIRALDTQPDGTEDEELMDEEVDELPPGAEAARRSRVRRHLAEFDARKESVAWYASGRAA